MTLPRPKVLAVSHACVRGVNRELFRMLAQRGVDLTILAPTGIDKGGQWIAAEPAREGDPPMLHLPMQGRNNRLFRYEGLDALLTEQNPDIIYAETDTASLLAVDLGRWARRHGRRFIVQTNENLSWSLSAAYARGGLREWPAAIAKNLFNFFSRSGIDHVMVTSWEAEQVFRRHGYAATSVVPMGTDRRVFRYDGRLRARTRDDLRIPAGVPAVAYFGRMVPEKGVDTLIDALAGLTDIDFRVLLNKFESNDGYGAAIQRRIDQAGLRDRVIEVTARHGEIAGLMNAADVAVLPSRTTTKWVEQFGRVVPETMSCGVVMLVSDSGAPKELVADPALVFPEGDAAALKRLLRQLFDNPDACLAQRKRAMRHANATMSMRVQADRLLALLA